MIGRTRTTGGAPPARARPLYARVLRLRQLNPSTIHCFLLFEGTVMLGLLLALAELVVWWTVFALPVAVALMVKFNDVVAVAVARSAALVPEQEQERFRREMGSYVGWPSNGGQVDPGGRADGTS